MITGPLPPPAGGISIHIWRLKYLLESEFNVDFIDEAVTVKPEYFSVKSFNPLRYFRKISRADILYVQSGSRILKKIHIITGKLLGKMIIITLHGYGPKRKQPFRAMDNFFFNLSDKIILVNPDIANRLSLNPEKCIVKHAFLPPVMQEEQPLPAFIQDWIHTAKNNNEVLLCANASRLDMFKEQELYGLDMCIEVLKKLRDKGMAVSFIYTVSSLDSGEDRFNAYKQQIKDYGLENNFLLVSGKLSFVKLVEQSDIVLRPTNTDGDALTIREAIYLGKPILASDVTERPQGTTLFKTRDMLDFEAQLSRLINGVVPVADSAVAETTSNDSFRQFYTMLLHSVLEKKPFVSPKNESAAQALL